MSCGADIFAGPMGNPCSRQTRRFDRGVFGSPAVYKGTFDAATPDAAVYRYDEEGTESCLTAEMLQFTLVVPKR